MQETKLPAADVVRIIECLGDGCSVEATAEICEVDARTVQRLLERAGKRAADVHRLQLDELHGKTVKSNRNAKVVKVPKRLRKRLSTCVRAKKRARCGFIRLWP